MHSLSEPEGTDGNRVYVFFLILPPSRDAVDSSIKTLSESKVETYVHFVHEERPLLVAFVAGND